MKKSKIEHGFTIIEVVLVLAVAGLIFLMAFVALPALQRSQRDNARRDNLMNFVSEVKKYQISNRGALPGAGDKTLDGTSEVITVELNEDGTINGANNTWAGFYRDYLLKTNFEDPDGVPYKLSIMKCNANVREDVACTGYSDNNGNWLSLVPDTPLGTFPNNYRILVVLQAKCKGAEAVGSSNPRNLAVLYRLEGAGSYCFDT